MGDWAVRAGERICENAGCRWGAVDATTIIREEWERDMGSLIDTTVKMLAEQKNARIRELEDEVGRSDYALRRAVERAEHAEAERDAAVEAIEKIQSMSSKRTVSDPWEACERINCFASSELVRAEGGGE